MKTRMLIAILCSSSASIAAVYTNAWDVDLQRNPPTVIDVWRGESIALCARTGITNLPASAEFLWQSPGMGTSWYTTNAVATAAGDVTAVFAPAMDSGAASYSFFFRVGGGDLYRPRGTLKMQGSPGASPNSIDIPPRILDFSTVAVANPPWATQADIAAATGGISVAESDPLAAAWQTNHLATPNPHGITPDGIGALPDAWPATGTVARAVIAGTEDTWVSADDGSATLNYSGRVAGTYGDQIIVSGVDGEGYNGPDNGSVFAFSDYDAPVSTFTSGVWRIQINASVGSVALDREPDRRTWYADGAIPVGVALDLSPDEFDALAVGTVSLSWFGVGVISEPIVTEPGMLVVIDERISAATDGLLSAESDPLSLHKTGGDLSGPLVLDGVSGLTWQGVGIATNYTVRAEFDGTNINFNVYEVAR